MEDYLPVYPSLNSPDIQRIITRKKEFQELSAPADEKLPEGGGFYNHQKFFVRFMIMADRVLNIHEPGTGKSCAFIAAAEHFKGTGSYKKTYIVERGDNIIDEMKTQIVRSCVPGVYDSNIGDIGITNRSRNIRINKALSEWYEFKTYRKFATELKDMQDDEIIATYSQSIIVLDEVHNIVSNNSGSKETDEENAKMYPQFLRLCQLIRRSKICAVTATPILNEVEEAARIMNLLLPEGKQMPENVSGMTLAMMEPYFRGKITYVRASTRAAAPKYMGITLPATYTIDYPDDSDLNQDINHKPKILQKTLPSGIKIFPTPMGDLQEAAYLSIPYTAFDVKRIAAATIVLPFGNDSDFIKKDKGGKMKWVTPSEFSTWEHRGKAVSFQQWLQNGGDTTNLGRLSGKMKAIIDIERDAPGCSFIFTLLKEFSGMKIIAMIFTLFGFELFNDPLEQIFTSEGSRQVKESYPKRRRVAVITTSMGPAREEAVKTLFNSPANANGEYIKVLVGSRVARDGINVFHCRRMHLISPHWNFSGMIQAINRVLRANAHEALREILNKEALAKGLTGIEYDKYTNIDVEIYRHAIDYNINSVDKGVSDHSNADLHIYRTAEYKELKSRRVFRAMKICAVDAIINRGRNILQSTRDYTQECDYERCDYPSWEQLRDPSYVPSQDPIDTETYNVLHRDTRQLKSAILRELVEHKSVSYAKIFQEYANTEFEQEMVIKTLNDIRELCDKKIMTREGDRLFIVLGNNGIHLQRQIDIPTPYIRDLSIYESPNTSIIYRPPSELFVEMERNVVANDVNVVSYIYQQSESLQTSEASGRNEGRIRTEVAPQTFEQVKAHIKDLPKWRQKALLEECVVSNQRSNGLFRSSTVAGNILTVFKGYIFKISETDATTGRVIDIYIHTYQPHNYKETNHNAVTRFKDPKEIWIYKSNETLGWRSPIETEFEKYKKIVVNSINVDLERFEQYSIYGSIIDGKFRIRWNPAGSDPKTISDRRQTKKGMECASIPRTELIQMAWEEQIPPPAEMMSKVSIPKNEDDMRETLIANHFNPDEVPSWTGKKLQWMYLWHFSTDLTKKLCGLLRDKLEKSGRIHNPHDLY